jgi:hypothetical protein
MDATPKEVCSIFYYYIFCYIYISLGLVYFILLKKLYCSIMFGWIGYWTTWTMKSSVIFQVMVHRLLYFFLFFLRISYEYFCLYENIVILNN